MGAGNFDRRVELHAPHNRVTRSGGNERVWTKVTTVWAEQVRSAGGESDLADQVNAVTRATFRIRYRTGMGPDWRLVFRGQTYEINSVSEPVRNQTLELACTALNVQSGNV